MKSRFVQIVTCSILSIVAMAFADENAVIYSPTLLHSVTIESSVVEPAVQDTKLSIISPVLPPTRNITRVLVVNDKLNFELLESDVIDETEYDEDDEDDIKVPSVLLDNYSSGFGFIIPGGILTNIGGTLLAMLITSQSSFKSTNDYKYLITMSSLATGGGVVSLTFGILKQRLFVRMNNRYAPPKRNRTSRFPTQEIAPVVIR